MATERILEMLVRGEKKLPGEKQEQQHTICKPQTPRKIDRLGSGKKTTKLKSVLAGKRF